MRIAITGASGLLGEALLEEATGRHVVVAAVHDAANADGEVESVRLDLTSDDLVHEFVHSARADVIIHAAAITDVDQCEREPHLAEALNSEATRRIVDTVRNMGTRIVYLSTDFVFDGAHGPYAETDTPRPVNVYGRTKLEGEKAVHSLGERGVIVRSSSFLGHGGSSRPNFAERMLQTMREHPPLRAATDQFSNVTPVEYLASGIIRLLESNRSGTWHIAHPQILSRYQLARMIAELASIDPSRVEGVSYSELRRPASRPLRGGLVTEKADRALSLDWPPLKAAVSEFLAEVLRNS